MTQGREQELKFEILRREDFLELRDGPSWGRRGEPQRQVNHYFDTPDGALARSRMLLRIREEGARRILTLKCGTEVRPGYFDSLELEADVTAEALAEALKRPGAMLDWPHEAINELKRRVGRPQLRVSGRLENERVRRDVSGLELEVDRLRFPDGSEAHELEIETDDVERAEAWVRDSIVSRGIPLAPQRLTKMERFRKWQEAQVPLEGGSAGQ